MSQSFGKDPTENIRKPMCANIEVKGVDVCADRLEIETHQWSQRDGARDEAFDLNVYHRQGVSAFENLSEAWREFNLAYAARKNRKPRGMREFT